MKFKLLLLFFCICAFSYAQQANDCTDAILVCGNSTVASNVSGFGTQELDNTANACMFEETNSIWLKLKIEKSGSLAFKIIPDNENIVVDYDFFLFGPSDTCGNFNDPIRCSTTNPQSAGLTSNHTGLSGSQSDTSEGPGPDGDSFVSSINVIAGETYYLLVDRPIGNGGFSLDWTGSSDFLDPPTINEPSDILLCIANPATVLDLSITANPINTDPDNTISLHTSIQDAFDGINAIKNPEAFPINSELTTIYVKVLGKNDCFEITEFDIKVDNYITQEYKYVSCDQDADTIERFDLAEISNDILQSLKNANQLNISLHTTETNANNDIIPLPITSFDTATNTIYARIASIIDPGCFASIPVNLEVISSPVPQIAKLVQCDIDPQNSTDGITAFNLEQVFDNLLEKSDYTFSFYESIMDRDNNNPITNPIGYVNTVPFDQSLFYRAINTVVGCENIGELQIQVQPTTLSLNPQSPFFGCDENPDNTILESTFDLESVRATNYPNLEVNFYATLEDVTLELNPLSGNYTSQSTTIYVRIENSNQCQGVEEIQLEVNPVPSFEIPDSYLLCTDGPPIIIEAPLGYDMYRWVKNEGSSEQEIGTSITVSITEIGNYRLEAGFAYQVNGEIQICTTSEDFTVVPSNRAVITNYMVRDITDNNTVEVVVSGDGNYEYSLDGTRYQDNNFFENVIPGNRTIFVRDKNGCGITQQDISIIGYPRFFTPNGDGINDFWQIIGADNQFQAESIILIFDRYGKFISQISAESEGWNGSHNNVQLPASDYWFKALLQDGREFKGHFTLKR